MTKNPIKKTILASAFIMTFALIVAIVGISAAWFGDTITRSNTIIITSERPVGKATIDVETAKIESSDSSGKLVPAKIHKGLMLSGDGTENYDNLDVLDSSLIGTTKNQPLDSVASTIKVTFAFIYIGNSDYGHPNEKSVVMTLKTVTKENVRETNDDGELVYEDPTILDNYKSDFGFNFSLVNATLAPNGEISETTPNEEVQTLQTDDELYMILTPGLVYYFQAEVYFSKVDEEISPMILDSNLYFNFEVEAVERRNI